MEKTRLMNTPTDYKKFGVNPNQIEVWEDGRRDDSRPGAFEWWYFDMLLDDDTKVVIIFMDKDAATPAAPLSPYVRFEVTLPNGEHFHEELKVNAEDSFFSSEKCDIKLGPHTLTGDLKTYTIHLDQQNGLGADLVLESMSSPWRPGTGYIGFGENDKDYFTWLCSVPRGRVTGNLTVNGKSKEVKGFGYHDHQWGNVPPLMIWNHWFWIRHAFDDFSILIFDLVSNVNYGFKPYPLMFIQDTEGNIVFESYGQIDESKFDVESEYKQEATGKNVPKAFTYNFQDGNKSVKYSMKSKQELVAEDNYSMVPPDVKALFDRANIKPSYTRWVGRGKLTLNLDGATSEQEGDAIYEMVFNGATYKVDK